MGYEYCSAIGQDSHRFVDRMHRSVSAVELARPLVLGGIRIEAAVGLDGNSDADVVLHALTNAVSGLTGVNILGKVSDELCLEQGITDSRVYLEHAMDYLGEWEIRHLSFSIEGKRPHLSGWIDQIRDNIACLAGLEREAIGMTATTGE